MTEIIESNKLRIRDDGREEGNSSIQQSKENVKVIYFKKLRS